MGYPPPPPPPPPGSPGYPQPPAGPAGPPGGYGGYGGPPPGYPPPPPGAGGPVGGGSSSGGGTNKGLILLMAGLVGVVLLVVAGVLVVTLTGGEDDVELTSSQRAQALLTDGDIGEGFTESDEPDDDGDDPSDDEDIDASPECLDLVEQLEDEGESPFGGTSEDDDSETRDFTDEGGATISHGVGPDDGIIELYRDLVGSCDEITFDAAAGTSTIEFSEGPGIDDVDDAYVVDIDFAADLGDGNGEIAYGGRAALWEVRGNVSIVLITDGFEFDVDDVSAPPTTLPYDEGLFEDLVVLADDKLREVIDEA